MGGGGRAPARARHARDFALASARVSLSLSPIENRLLRLPWMKPSTRRANRPPAREVRA